MSEWDKLIRQSFIEALECAKEIKPNTPEWTFIWNSLQHFKLYAERKHEAENKTNVETPDE
jgi:hypothetical protein